MNAVGSVLSERNFAFSGSLNRGFLVGPSIYPEVTRLSNTKRRINMVRINPKVKILAARLYSLTSGIMTIRLSGQLLPILRRALSRRSGIGIMGSSVLGVSLRGLVRRRFRNVSIIIYTGLPCCVASPMVVGLLRSELPVYTVAIVIRGRTTRQVYTRINSHTDNTMAMSIGCCTRPRVLFSIDTNSFVPTPGISSTILELGVLGRPPIGISSRGGFFGIMGTTFSRQEGALSGSLTSKLSLPGTRIGTVLRGSSIPLGTETRRLGLRSFTGVTGGLNS